MIDGVSLQENTESLSSGIAYSITKDRIFRNLRISNVCAGNVKNAGIILEKTKNACLENNIVSGNIARIEDQIKDKNV